jgi:hypothetical protein
MYSVFSEVLRLIPPEGYQNQIRDTRKRAVSTEREQSLDRKKACATRNHMSDYDTRVGDIKCESNKSSITTHKTNTMISSTDASSYMTTPITHQEEIRSIPRSASDGMFWELDALLRF